MPQVSTVCSNTRCVYHESVKCRHSEELWNSSHSPFSHWEMHISVHLDRSMELFIVVAVGVVPY